MKIIGFLGMAVGFLFLAGSIVGLVIEMRDRMRKRDEHFDNIMRALDGISTRMDKTTEPTP